MKSQGRMFVIAALLFALFASENSFSQTEKELLQRGEEKQKAGDLKGAMHDYDTNVVGISMLTLISKDIHHLPILKRSFMHQSAIYMARGEYGAALASFDLIREPEFAGKPGINTVDCYQWLIRIHQGKKTLADQELTSRLSQTANASNVDPEVQAAKYFLGQVPEADLITFAKKKDSKFTKHKIHESEGVILYYIGMKHYLEGDLAEAKKDFKKVLTLSHTDLDSQTMAKGGLYQIEQTKAQKSTAPAAEKGATLSTAPVTYKAPSDVAVDSQGNVYVADTNNFIIRKITPDGVVTNLAGSVGVKGMADGKGINASFGYLRGIAVDSQGNVYVSDTSNDLIRKITPDGLVATLAGSGDNGSANGTGTSATFSGPEGMAVDANGSLYVADALNSLIRKITPEGVVTTLAGQAGVRGHKDGPGLSASFDQPDGIALDSKGNVYVAEEFNQLIRKITPGGIVSTLAGQAGVTGQMNGTGSSATFNHPRGVAVDKQGNVFVGDKVNNLIRKITSDGTVTTIAGGSRNGGGYADGSGSDALFRYPNGIAVDSDDNLYIADMFNDRVRKLTPDGVVTTLTGPEVVSGAVTTPAPSAVSQAPAVGTGSVAAKTEEFKATVNSAEPYTTDESVTFTGAFSKDQLPYEENKMETVAFLTLSTPIDVNEDGMGGPVAGATKLQLMPYDNKLKDFEGKSLTVIGELFYPLTIHNHTDVLLSVKKIIIPK